MLTCLYTEFNIPSSLVCWLSHGHHDLFFKKVILIGVIISVPCIKWR